MSSSFINLLFFKNNWLPCPSRQFLLIPLKTQLSILKTLVGKGAINKFGSCCQWRNEHFKPRMLLFSVGNDAMNASRHRTTAQWTPLWYWQRRSELLRRDFLAISFQIVHSCTKWRCSFKGLWQDRWVAGYSKNHSASVFNKTPFEWT
jgi:hypothetical protein